MTNLFKSKKALYRAGLLFLAVGLLGSATIFSRTGAQTASLAVTNSTNREIRHLYLSALNSNDWGPDQLNESMIPPGGSSTLSISCDQSNVKIIAEDQNGCFVSTVVSCGPNIAWTITNDLNPDCGN